MFRGMVKRMTSKDIHLAVKRPDGLEYLMRRFSFQTVMDLESAIRHVSPAQAEDAIKTLRKKHSKLGIVEEVAVRAVLPPVDEEKSSDAEAYSMAFEPTDAVAMITDDCEEERDVQDMVMSVTLEQAKQYEQELSDMVCNLEGRHKVLVAQRRECLLRLGKIRREADCLRQQLHVKEEEAKKLFVEYNECHEEMTQINLERTFQQELLEEARERRAALEKVTILVFADGSVSVENAELPSVEEDELGKEFNRLLALPVPEDFTIKTVRNIARLHLMLKAFGEKAELMFDSSELESFWETVVAA